VPAIRRSRFLKTIAVPAAAIALKMLGLIPGMLAGQSLVQCVYGFLGLNLR
jgi:hypothetical protein